jgi:hypothetical protein
MMDEGLWSSDPSDLDNFYNQRLTIYDFFGFPAKVGIGAAAASCVIMKYHVVLWQALSWLFLWRGSV